MVFVVAGRLNTAIPSDGRRQRRCLLTCFDQTAVQGIFEISREATVAWSTVCTRGCCSCTGTRYSLTAPHTWRCGVERLDCLKKRREVC